MAGMNRLRRMAARLWPTLFGPEEAVTKPEVDRIYLPPEPMFKAPDEETWRPL